MSSLILFDGLCNLCSGSVQFVVEHDPAGRFQFASLQSASGRRVLREHGVAEPGLETMVLVEDGRVFTRSTAALRIARRLPFPWPLVAALMVVPRPLRDWVYGVVARYRYRWFGKLDHCMIPTAALRSRFLD